MWLCGGKETWVGFWGRVGCVVGLRRTLADFRSGGRTRANQVATIDKHGATPHAARDNPYVGLLLTPRFFDLYTILLKPWIELQSLDTKHSENFESFDLQSGEDGVRPRELYGRCACGAAAPLTAFESFSPLERAARWSESGSGFSCGGRKGIDVFCFEKETIVDEYGVDESGELRYQRVAYGWE